MLLNSPEFFWFLALLFFGYWLVWRIRIAGLLLIVAANYFFYAKWSWIYLILVPAASTTDFLIGRQLARSENQTVRKWLVTGSVVLNVGLIAVCKYVPFFSHIVSQVSSGALHIPSWTFPLGLSFYAFQAMTYTLDIYRRDAEPAKTYLEYLASVSFFPTTLAGPITRVAALLPQWRKPNRVIGSAEGGRALFLIAIGLSKKFLIADYLAVNLVNRVFDLPTLYSGGEVLVAVYAYAFQLYYDFSGYTDIALGSALLLGIKLPGNFNRPYQAENIADFWRRWHITFSSWLRDYLYFSLPGKRSKVMPYLNLVITFTIGGLWHGANLTFVAWGVWHGLGLAAVRLRRALTNNRKPSAAWPLRAMRVFVTFHFVAFTWIFFRSADLATAWQMLGQIASMHWAFDNVTAPFATVLAIALLLHFTPKRWYAESEKLFSASPAPVQAVALVALVLAIQYVGATGATPFIYSKF
jgi:alginate O-acetyltransferase complex protein AlgI